jgi:HlyD family secretion protein
MNSSRVITILIIVGAVVAALVYGFMPRPVFVDVIAVSRGPLSVTVDAEGKTRVIDRFIVSAPVAGYARRSALDVGVAVVKGQTLVELEPRRSEVLDPRTRAEAKARVAAAEATESGAKENVRGSKADSALAESELKRIRSLHKRQYATEERLDRAVAEGRRAQAALRSAEFAVKVARFELDAARTALKYSGNSGGRGADGPMAIKAPVEGRVLKILQESEGVVNSGDPLVEIGDPTALEVEVEVLSADAVRIKPGTRVLFERWGGTVPLEGVVRVVEPAGFTKVSALGVEEQRVLVITDITSAPEVWAGLGDGYRVEASFILWEADSVLQVPSSVLFRYGDSFAAFAVEGSKAVRRSVEVGHRSGLSAEVLSGVTEGEVLITHPDDSIDDGVSVRTREAGVGVK